MEQIHKWWKNEEVVLEYLRLYIIIYMLVIHCYLERENYKLIVISCEWYWNFMWMIPLTLK